MLFHAQNTTHFKKDVGATENAVHRKCGILCRIFYVPHFSRPYMDWKVRRVLYDMRPIAA